MGKQLSSAVYDVKEQYNRLGLRVPFNDVLLIELMTVGIGPTRRRLELMIEYDLKPFHNENLTSETLARVDNYLKPLDAALKHLIQVKNHKNKLVYGSSRE